MRLSFVPFLAVFQERPVEVIRWLIPIVFAVAALYYMAISWHWRLTIDSPIMHYVVFLLRHGYKPYSEISDNNMPGAYLTEAAAMRVFGPSDVGWRLYEFFLLGVMTATMAALARSWDWVAGVFAGGMFLVLHAAEGPQYAGERELTLTALVLVAYLALFQAVDTPRPAFARPWLMFCFGLAAGVATSIKHTFLPLPIAVLALALWVLRQRQQRLGPSLLAAFVGLLVMPLAAVGFIAHYHALAAFRFVVVHVLPAYVGLPHVPGYGSLLAHALPYVGFGLVAVSVPLALQDRPWPGSWNWKRWAFLLGAGFGLFSYLAQHKGFLHHRYTLVSFVYLLVGIELLTALRRPGWPRLVACIVLIATMGLVVPRALAFARRWPNANAFELALERDFDKMGGSATLQDKVQCFDLVYGCLNALYHERIAENTGFTGDLLFFSRKPGSATEYYRERFWRLAQQDPASVLVMSNEDLMEPNSFDRVHRWPAFDAYLQANYTEVVERHFSHERLGVLHPEEAPAADQDAYRLYIRKGSPLLAQWESSQNIGGTAP